MVVLYLHATAFVKYREPHRSLVHGSRSNTSPVRFIFHDLLPWITTLFLSSKEREGSEFRIQQQKKCYLKIQLQFELSGTSN